MGTMRANLGDLSILCYPNVLGEHVCISYNLYYRYPISFQEDHTSEVHMFTPPKPDDIISICPPSPPAPAGPSSALGPTLNNSFHTYPPRRLLFFQSARLLLLGLHLLLHLPKLVGKVLAPL